MKALSTLRLCPFMVNFGGGDSTASKDEIIFLLKQSTDCGTEREHSIGEGPAAFFTNLWCPVHCLENHQNPVIMC